MGSDLVSSQETQPDALSQVFEVAFPADAPLDATGRKFGVKVRARLLLPGSCSMLLVP